MLSNLKVIRDNFYIFRHGGYKRYFFKIYSAIFNSNSIETKHKEEIISITDEVRFVAGETILFGNIFFYVDLPSFDFIKNEMFNLEIYKFNSTKNEPLILDCGANIGLSIIYFKTLYPNSQIIAFEPDPMVFNVLKKNVKSFNLEHVTLHNLALWTHEGEINFFSEGADGGRIEENIDVSKKNVQLKTTLLSKYIETEIDFLKIDIEGAEFEVLNECKHKLHLVKNLFVEYHSMVNEKQKLSEILKILADKGFRYYISSIGINSPHPFLERNETIGMDNQLNIFATRD